MVICGPDPNLIRVLESTKATAGYPNSVRLDHALICIVASHTPAGTVRARLRSSHAAVDRTGSPQV